MYIHMLPQRELTLRFNNQGVPPWEDRALRLAWPLAVRWAAARARRSDPESRTRMKPLCGASSTSSPSCSPIREHLCGERFGAADLTFASLSAAVVVPPVYGVPLPQPNVLPAQTAALVQRAREHPAGRYALALFAEHRRLAPT